MGCNLDNLIRANYDAAASSRPRRMTARDVLAELGHDRPTSTDCHRAAQTLRAMFGAPACQRGRNVFRMPGRVGPLAPW